MVSAPLPVVMSLWIKHIKNNTTPKISDFSKCKRGICFSDALHMRCRQKNPPAPPAAAALHLAQHPAKQKSKNYKFQEHLAPAVPGSACLHSAGGDVPHILLCQQPGELLAAFSAFAFCKVFLSAFPDLETDRAGVMWWGWSGD